MNAVDTNTLVYSFDAHNHAKRTRALDFLNRLSGDDPVLPWQVACEFGSVPARVAREGRFRGDYRETVSSVRNRFPIALPQLSTLARSLRIQTEAQVSPWDALLIAACADAGVTRLDTEDMQGRPSIEGVELVNPLA